MASSDAWEFNCPQFVDFTISADSPENSSNFFDDRSPRGVEKAELSYSKANSSSVDMLCMPSEHKRFGTTNFTDSQKFTISKQLGQRLSKSDGDIARHLRNIKTPALGEQKTKKAAKGPFKSRRTCPTTPMCLRRTMVNALKKFKTSEELEMEKIAELQKKTRLHIRNNQLNLRKMKQKRETNVSEAQKFVLPQSSVKRGWSFKAPQKAVAINVQMNLEDKSSAFQRSKSVSQMKTIAEASRQPGRQMLATLLSNATFPRNVPDFNIKPLDPAPSQASDDECFLKPSNLHTGLRFRTNGEGCSLKPRVNKDMTRSTSSLSSDDGGNIKEVPKKAPYRFSYNKENIIARRPPPKALAEVMRKVQAKMAAKSESASSLPKK